MLIQPSAVFCCRTSELDINPYDTMRILKAGLCIPLRALLIRGGAVLQKPVNLTLGLPIFLHQFFNL